MTYTILLIIYFILFAIIILSLDSLVRRLDRLKTANDLLVKNNLSKQEDFKLVKALKNDAEKEK